MGYLKIIGGVTTIAMIVIAMYFVFTVVPAIINRYDTLLALTQ